MWYNKNMIQYDVTKRLLKVLLFIWGIILVVLMAYWIILIINSNLKVGEPYKEIDGMNVTIEETQTFQRENYGEVYTFTAFKVKYENKGIFDSLTLADFKIKDETGKTVNWRETSYDRWGFHEKGIPTGLYSPGSSVEGWMLFKGDAQSITLTLGHIIDLATWKIKQP